MIMKGTGRPRSHPATRIGFRPTRSDRRAATRLRSALVTPKLTMNETIAVFDARPNSRSPMSGTTVRSRPTMAPDEGVDQDEQRELAEVRPQAQTDGARSSRGTHPRRLAASGGPGGDPALARRRVGRSRAALVRLGAWPPCPRGIGGRSRVRAATNSSSPGHPQERIEPLLEGQRRHGLAAHPLPARGAREVGRVDLRVVWQGEEPPEAPMERPGARFGGARAGRAARRCPRRACRPSARTTAPARASCR